MSCSVCLYHRPKATAAAAPSTMKTVMSFEAVKPTEKGKRATYSLLPSSLRAFTMPMYLPSLTKL